MSQQTVCVLTGDESRMDPFGPAFIEHRTAQAGFNELGTYFMTFAKSGHADPWTLKYEESIYVISGHASILVLRAGQETEVRAGEGELMALPKGATVRYGGEAGTRLLLSIAPVNWRKPAESVKDVPTQERAAPRILFLTPFNFATAEHDDKFDALVSSLVSRDIDNVVAAHVERFDPATDDYDAIQTEAVLKAVQKANTDFDAIVIACHYDPAVAEARVSSTVPVIGPLQLTTSMARQYGPRFAVITDVPEAEPVIAGLIESYGHGDHCTGVTSIGWEMEDIVDNTRGAAEATDRLIAEIAAKGEAQSIVIGCTIVSAAYESHRHRFPDRGVVVLNSNLVTLKGAAAIAAK